MKPTTLVTLTTLPLILLAAVVYAKYSAREKKESPVKFDNCVVVGSNSAPAIIKVWNENADNTKGEEILPERWIQRDERIPIPAKRGRVIYIYKYRSQDAWNTEVHAWCHNGEDRKIP